MTDQNAAAWFIYWLTGSAETVMDWRCIHDKDKGRAAHNYRGTLSECWQTLLHYNNNGYGIFCVINAMDGQGRELENVSFIRAHFVDLDNVLISDLSLSNAIAAGANFYTNTSPQKYHVYFKMHPYSGNDFFNLQQRKLIELYGSDFVVDPTRVMRVPGFLHQKEEPFLITGHALPSMDRLRTAEEIQAELAHVNAYAHTAIRSPLGSPEMSAPSLEWLKYALTLIDPNDLSYNEWLSFSAAIKQAGWNHTTPENLYDIWSEWCSRYVSKKGNDLAENIKLWESVKDTEVGWTSIERRTPIKAYMLFGFKEPPPVNPTPQTSAIPADATSVLGQHEYGEILNEYECQQYFKDCYFVNKIGKIFTPCGNFMNSTQFNGAYGGKKFISTSTGKLADKPWEAALSSTCWTVPKVDHIRFLPDRPRFEVVLDALGRPGLNTYTPARIDARPGDVTPWLEHIKKILPVENDRKILFDYLAHNVKFPGHKIPWSIMIQSFEGIGKTVFIELMSHALGDMYTYSPKASELIKSGSTFNAWQRARLFIVVNEIWVDERRELSEILKPLITDLRVEVQGKGENQQMEDNPANWLFFSNHKGAIPITRKSRRYTIFYSAIQTLKDFEDLGMGDDYFNALWTWLREQGGLQFITHWLLNYPIEKGKLPVRAPRSSCFEQVLKHTRLPLQVAIDEAILDGLPGFRGGYVSTLAAIARGRLAGVRGVNLTMVKNCLEAMEFTELGRALRPYMQEDHTTRAELFGNSSSLKVDGYARAQGYE